MQSTKDTKSKSPAETLRIRGRDIPVSICYIPHTQLRFYSDNPRVFSALRMDGRAPSQKETESHLLELDHVKALIHDIKRNGGLIDPIIVRKNEVIEGNSRLAAYRALANKDPIKWANVKCTVLPDDTDDALVFAILGQYHIKGKKDWQPFEQAGFLYRRHINQKVDQKTLAEEIGLSSGRIKHLINTYQFMVERKQSDASRWSYFDEYLKSSKIRKARDKYPELDDVVVSGIESGAIERAVDVRDRLPAICCGPKKTLAKYVEEELSFEQAYELAEASGADNTQYKRLEKFRHWIVKKEVEDFVVSSNNQIRGKIKYELGKILDRAIALNSKIKST